MNELYEKIAELKGLVREIRKTELSLNDLLADTSRGQGRILAVLKLKDQISTKDLAYLLAIRVSSLNEALLKMEKAGYLTRIPAADDKRVMLVQLTPSGRDIPQPQAFDYDSVFSVLSQPEKVQLQDLLDKVLDSLYGKLNVTEEERTNRQQIVRDRLDNTAGFLRHGHRLSEYHRAKSHRFQHLRED